VQLHLEGIGLNTLRKRPPAPLTSAYPRTLSSTIELSKRFSDSAATNIETRSSEGRTIASPSSRKTVAPLVRDAADMNPGRDPNYTPTPNSMYQQFYGQQSPQQGGYSQQQFPPQGFANQQQAAQFQQYQQQQQQFPSAYDANGLAHQLQNQHLSARQAGSPGSPQRPRTSGSSQASGSLRDDYVIFNRDDLNFSASTRERAKALKLKVELHYNQSVAHAVERNQR
jgi:hypothetical protein